MVVELVVGTFFAELIRAAYYVEKEIKRNEKAGIRFGEIVDSCKTLEELGHRLSIEHNPELYDKIPQTWMIRLYWKLIKE